MEPKLFESLCIEAVIAGWFCAILSVLMIVFGVVFFSWLIAFSFADLDRDGAFMLLPLCLLGILVAVVFGGGLLFLSYKDIRHPEMRVHRIYNQEGIRRDAMPLEDGSVIMKEVK